MFRRPGKTFKIAITIIFVYIVGVVTLACSQPSGEFFYGSLGLGEKRILVATSNPAAFTILLYDLNGALIDVIADFTSSNDNPKGIAPFDAFSFGVLLDGADRIARVSLTGGGYQTIAADLNFTGALFHMAHDPSTDRYYAIEANTIEAFDRASGARLGPGGATPYIATTLSTCVLATPRGVYADGEGRLMVVGTGNDRLNVYNVTGATATCTGFNAALNTTDPVAIIGHSNGLIYVATQADDRVYSLAHDGTGAATVVWATNTAVINNPTALLELPDGTILVASDTTNSIERITPAGVQVGATSFIRDAFSGLVSQMMLIGGE